MQSDPKVYKGNLGLCILVNKGLLNCTNMSGPASCGQSSTHGPWNRVRRVGIIKVLLNITVIESM